MFPVHDIANAKSLISYLISRYASPTSILTPLAAFHYQSGLNASEPTPVEEHSVQPKHSASPMYRFGSYPSYNAQLSDPGRDYLRSRCKYFHREPEAKFLISYV